MRRTALEGVTATGWMALVGGAAATAGGLWLHWTEVIVAGISLLVLSVVAPVMGWLPRTAVYDLEVRPLRTTAGGHARALIAVRSGRLPLLAPRVIVPVGSEVVRIRLPMLAAGASHTEEADLATPRRGVHVVGPLTELRSDLLGLYSRTVACTPAVEVFTRPRTVPLEPLAPGWINDLEGVPSSQLSVSDLSFHALREYVRGDDLRHVHWRSSARADHLLVRQYQETRRSSVAVLIDTDHAAYTSEDDFEMAVSAAASVLKRAIQDDFEAGLGWDDQVVVSSASHPDPLLDATCRPQLDRGTDGEQRLLATAGRLAAGFPDAGSVFLITGSLRRPGQLALAADVLARGGSRYLVQVGSGEPSILVEERGGALISLGDLDRLGYLLVGHG